MGGDWEFTSGSGKSRTTFNFSYVMISTPRFKAATWIRPENVFDRIETTLGFNDLDFENIEFSDLYHVRSDTPRYTFDLFHPPMIELFLRERPPWVRFGDGVMVVYSKVERWEPVEFPRWLEFGKRVIETWPRHLLGST